MNVPGSGVNRETTVIVVFPKEGPREPQEIVSNRSQQRTLTHKYRHGDATTDEKVEEERR